MVKKGTSGPAVKKQAVAKVTVASGVAAPATKTMGKKTAANGAKPGKSTKAAQQKAPPASDLATIFVGAGFSSIAVEGTHLDFKGRTSEFDHAFAYENLIVLCEETTDKSPSKHFTNKVFFYDLVAGALGEFVEEFGKINPAFLAHVESCGYLSEELEFRYLYYSSVVDCETAQKNPGPFKYLERSHANYFRHLVKIIGKSAKYELLKYLAVGLSDLGDQRRSGKPAQSDPFDAFCLSGKHIN